MSDDDRPEWWEVQIKNLQADPDLLQRTLHNLTAERDHARHLCVLLEQEIAQLEQVGKISGGGLFDWSIS